jgi:deazaflavin-dependent oxidoreductase (nitroreductase family)
MPRTGSLHGRIRLSEQVLGQGKNVSLGLIVAVAIAATAVLLMRFRKRWLAKFNIIVTNRITGLFAGWLPGFGILSHIGRKSGRIYRTPINVFRSGDGFIIALTYSSESEWVKNVLAWGGCELKTLGRKYQLGAPKVVHDPMRRRFPFPVRLVLMLVGADEYMELSKSPSAVLSKLRASNAMQ